MVVYKMENLNGLMEDINHKIKQQELMRKILHVLIGIIALFLLIYHVITPLIIFIILAFGLSLSLLSLKFKIPLVSFFLENFERAENITTFPGRGLFFAIAGSLLALKLFPEDIALASIIILTFADPFSHLIGKVFGHTPSILDRRKNIEGHLAGFLISSLFAMFFVRPALAIAGSLLAMLFESVVIKVQKIQLDDNLIIPLVAGTTMLLLRMFFM